MPASILVVSPTAACGCVFTRANFCIDLLKSLISTRKLPGEPIIPVLNFCVGYEGGISYAQLIRAFNHRLLSAGSGERRMVFTSQTLSSGRDSLPMPASIPGASLTIAFDCRRGRASRARSAQAASQPLQRENEVLRPTVCEQWRISHVG